MRFALAAALLLAAPLGAGPQRQLLPLDETGYRKVLASHQGNVVLVDIWATWCAPCIEELPRVVRLEQKYRAKGFRLVTVSCDEPKDRQQALQFLEKHRAPMPAYLKQVANDEDFINWLDRKWSGALPALFLYDRAGRKAQSFVGETDLAELEKAILKLL